MREPILTERLVVRDITEADAQLLFDLDSDPEVLRYIGPRPANDVAAYRERIQTVYIPQQAHTWYGVRIVLGRASQEFLGWVFIRPATAAKEAAELGWTRPGDEEVGYRYRRSAWGRGIATEAAAPLVKIALADPATTAVVACARADNAGSLRVLEKLGLARVGEVMMRGASVPTIKLARVRGYPRSANPVDQHARQIVDQFSRQAVYFARLPGHEDATQLLLRMAGVTNDDEVLDVACGAGAVACAAAQVARQVTGIDLTPAMIERAAALQSENGLSNLTWHVGDVTRLPFRADHFDLVLTRYSFHHFLNPAEVLAEMVRVCKSSGRVAVADLVLPLEKVAAYDHMERLRDPSHVRVLTETELRAMLNAAGLVDLRWAGYLFELELEALLQASFPQPDGASRVRELIEADVGTDNLGISVHHSGGAVCIAYPIAVAVGIKPSERSVTYPPLEPVVEAEPLSSETPR